MKHEPMTQEQLDAIRGRVDGATNGPWGCYGDGAHEVFDAGEYGDGDRGEVVAAVIDRLSDAVFIANAREDIPALLAEVERLSQRVGDLEYVAAQARKAVERLRALTTVTEDMVGRAKRAFGAATAQVSSIPLGMSEDMFIDSVGLQHQHAIRAVLDAALGTGEQS